LSNSTDVTDTSGGESRQTQCQHWLHHHTVMKLLSDESEHEIQYHWTGDRNLLYDTGS